MPRIDMPRIDMPRIILNCRWLLTGNQRCHPAILLVFLLWPVSAGRAAEGRVDYQTQIKPILRARCYACHGALKQKAGLRLDTAALAIKGGDSGAAITPGDGESLLLTRVTAADEVERMPPEGEPLEPEQIALLKRWIAENAESPADEQPERDPHDHWAFKPPGRPAVPTVANAKWVRNPIDAFLSKQHEEHGLAPQPEASRAVLLRRLSIDLIGLPPSLAELDAFESDTSPDWYENAVTRLLADKRHGERWGRHWMDVWRYSDWWGLGEQLRNSQKHIWHWRDWIVESLNEDVPYDEMVRQMLAADELYPNDLKKLRATGYLARNWFLFNRHQWMDETVEHVSKSLLGMTLNCAKCHDHKFDPIEQADYYKMRAFFEPYHVRMELAPGETDITQDGIPRVFDGLLDAPTYLFERGDEKHPDKSTVIAPGVPELLAFKPLNIQPVSLPPEAWQPERRAGVLDAHLAAAKRKLESAASGLATAGEKLAAARKQEAEIVVTPPRPAVAATDKAATTFQQPEPEKWKLFGGEWVHTPGGLEQKRDGATRAAVRWLEKVPTDFDATVRFTIRGGSLYRSVGLSFDASQADPTQPAAADDSELMVYASAWANGPKVQAAFARGSVWQYPANGLKTLPLETDREYTLRVQVRGTLVNAALNGESVIAWQSPLARRDGALQLITFDALAVFHEFSLSPLDPATSLRQPQGGPVAKPLTVEESKSLVAAAQSEFTIAELAAELARVELLSLELRVAALRATWNNSTDVSDRVLAAVKSEREVAVIRARHQIAEIELRLVRAASDKKAPVEKELKAARESLDKATQAAAAPVAQTDQVTAPAGAKWTPTRFLNSGADDPAIAFPATSSGRRSALADWITDARNPLTARVAVNHLWTRHLGTPLAPGTFEFGRKNPAPANPALIDWLASELVENGWSMKHLHRLIVTSAAYRMSTSIAGGEASLAKDPDNLRWWRRTPIRIESQAVRDSLLALAGQLDPAMGGPPVPTAAQAGSKRRSLYFFHSNNERNLFLTTFDEANVKECYQREQSIVPQQALALFNSGLVLDCAAPIATRLGADIPLENDTAFVRQAFRGLLGDPPDADELAACVQTLDAWRKIPGATPEQARVHLVWVLLNHNDFVSLR